MAVVGGKRKTLVGSVVSGKMEKTIIVAIESLKKHPLYGKYIKSRVKYMVHDEKGIAKPGDKVAIVETRPVSKRKRWRIKEVLEKSQ